MASKLESKGAKLCKNLVDLVKRFQTLAKTGFDTAENGPLKVYQKVFKIDIIKIVRSFKKEIDKPRSRGSGA